MPHRLILLGLLVLLGACASRPPDPPPSSPPSTTPPQPVRHPIVLPRPQSQTLLLSVAVDNVPVRELLQALARDARIDLDLHPQVQGSVTLQARQRSLPHLLERIRVQLPLRYRLHEGVLSVRPDTPYLHSYPIDYPSFARTFEAGLGSALGAQTSQEDSNRSTLTLISRGGNDFWAGLAANVQALIDLDLSDQERQSRLQRDRQFQLELVKAASPLPTSGNSSTTPAPNNGESINTALRSVSNNNLSNVAIHRETGTLTVAATERQHRTVARFLAQVIAASRRQVMIEATVVEIRLGDGFQSGIDWQRVGELFGTTLTLGQQAGLHAPAAFSINLKRGSLDASLRLLSRFGDARVLSNPRLLALNNQPALLKVVEELQYLEQGALQTVPVGLQLALTPQIGAQGDITLLIRPTLTRLKDFAIDPASGKPLAPQRFVRELETVLRLTDGQTAVIGGLMEKQQSRQSDGLPNLLDLPWLGRLFGRHDESRAKTELVLLLRPRLIDASPVVSLSHRSNPDLTDTSSQEEALP
ncbi:type II secretion system protein GspD [Chitinimonas lacunae]|uniref:Type II secretion system protein GspD n=1 Tax=Chitinimonas lacunae TaxID=1963018 RepID=A0ABV8MPK8_9NEIS